MITHVNLFKIKKLKNRNKKSYNINKWVLACHENVRYKNCSQTSNAKIGTKSLQNNSKEEADLDN